MVEEAIDELMRNHGPRFGPGLTRSSTNTNVMPMAMWFYDNLNAVLYTATVNRVSSSGLNSGASKVLGSRAGWGSPARVCLRHERAQATVSRHNPRKTTLTTTSHESTVVVLDFPTLKESLCLARVLDVVHAVVRV